MIPIFEALETYKRVIAVMGVQMGKTGGVFNVIGRTLDDEPAPILYVGPTKSNVDRVIEPQITAMLRSAPSLWAVTNRGRKAQKLAKEVNGVSLRLAWAGSPTELASQPAKIVIVDERDRMAPIPGEGDVMELAEGRITNYRGGRIIGTSTPTEGNVDVEKHPDTGVVHWKVGAKEDVLSPIWQLWQEGTRHEWSVPCPHCHDHFIPRLRNLWWPEKCSPRAARSEARLVCPNCAAMIEDSSKVDMNAAGLYLAPGQKVVDGKVIGDPPDSDSASFWVSGLMSPWRTWGERAAAVIRAQRGGDDKLRTVINTALGELYAFRGEAPPSAVVRLCTGIYSAGQVPAGARWLTCGVDVQKRRLVYAVRGWGFQLESWLIEYGDIHGPTDERAVWDQLEEILQREWGGGEGKRGLTIMRMGIDSGYRPGDKWKRPENIIYEFCMKHPKRAAATKGHDRQTKPLAANLIDVTIRGQVLKRGLLLWNLDSDHFKSIIHTSLLQDRKQAIGRFWVPQDVDEDYCLQVTAETRVPKPSGLAVWVKVRGENHYFDCEVINLAMAYSLGIHRRSRPKTAEQRVEEAEEAMPTPMPSVPPKASRPPTQTQRRPSNWATSWRR